MRFISAGTFCGPARWRSSWWTRPTSFSTSSSETGTRCASCSLGCVELPPKVYARLLALEPPNLAYFERETRTPAEVSPTSPSTAPLTVCC